MADNVAFQTTVATPASGTNVAADEATYSGDTAKVQIVRLVHVSGAEGSKTVSEIADATNGIDVDVTRLPALVAGTANIGDVDVLTVPAPLSTTGGGVEATALRVTLASDSTGLVSVDDNGGSLTVDGTVSVSGAVDTELTTADLDTGAGTDTRAVVGLALAASGGALLVGSANPMPVSDNAGSLTVDGSVSLAAAIPAGTNNIGDVDVLTVPAPLSTTGGGVEATALRVTLASDSTGLVSVDDNGGSLTVDGTVTANLAAGTNNIGDVDVLSIAAGDNNIGNVDVVTLPALVTGSAVIGRVGHDTTGFGNGRKVVTTAGTRVALASTTTAKWVVITAETDNTGIVVVGTAAGVIAALATREGIPLNAGDTITLPCDDLAEVGLDSTVSGDGVTFMYGT